jgi:hypothetical protein
MVKLALPLIVFVTGCAETNADGVTDATIASSSVRAAPPVATIPLEDVRQAYFPPNTFSFDGLEGERAQSIDQFVSDWYGKQLAAMNEPSLWAAAVHGETAYRFLWLRTWGRPIAVRVTVDGVRARLFVTRFSGSGGYDPGEIDVHRERELEARDVGVIEAALSTASFDTIDTQGTMGADGAEWVLERAKGGVYRMVERWTPRHNPKYAAFVAACDLLLDLAGRDLVSGDVY